MHRLRTRVLIITILCLAPSLAYCNDGSKSAKVEELFRLMKADDLLKQTMKAVMEQIKSGMLQEFLGIKLPPDIEKEVADFQDKTAAMISDAMSWDKLEPEYAKLYLEAYSEEELDGIIAFYKTPAGQAMVAKSPSVIAKSSAIAQQKLMSVAPQVQKELADFSEKIKAELKDKDKQ